ncbi:MAG: helix-turn-helix domain-containing protein [Pseudomonadota bacterium]
MAKNNALITALKKTLKSHGKTYDDVAAALALSTASVKRLFSEHSLSVKRLEIICAMLDIEVSDLLQQIAEDGWQLKQLSDAQERAITEDLELLLVTVGVLNRLSLEDILTQFAINEHSVIRNLAWLDRQGLIELLPKNRIKLKVSGNFAWRPDGPIQRFFQEKVSADYFSTRFTGEGEKLLVLNGMLTNASLDQFQRRLDRLAREFEELVNQDQGQAIEKRIGQTVVLAVRPWRFGVFQDYTNYD